MDQFQQQAPVSGAPISPEALKKVEMWLMSHSGYFKPQDMMALKDMLTRLPEDRLDLLYAVDLKNPTTIMLISIFLGEFGVDRFMLGDIGLGVGKLLTFGGCLVWWLIDIFFVSGRAKEKNYIEVMNLFHTLS